MGTRPGPQTLSEERALREAPHDDQFDAGQCTDSQNVALNDLAPHRLKQFSTMGDCHRFSFELAMRTKSKTTSHRSLKGPAKDACKSEDAQLLELGQQFEELWRHERCVEDALKSRNLSLDEQEQDRLLDKAAASTEAIANEIFNTPATGLAGLIVKARAVQWQLGAAGELLSGRYSEGMTTIVRDLLRLRSS